MIYPNFTHMASQIEMARQLQSRIDKRGRALAHLEQGISIAKFNVWISDSPVAKEDLKNLRKLNKSSAQNQRLDRTLLRIIQKHNNIGVILDI